jgi:hypothetical protein
MLSEHRSASWLLVCMLIGGGLFDSYRVCFVGLDYTLQKMTAVVLLVFLLDCKQIRILYFQNKQVCHALVEL